MHETAVNVRSRRTTTFPRRGVRAICRTRTVGSALGREGILAKRHGTGTIVGDVDGGPNNSFPWPTFGFVEGRPPWAPRKWFRLARAVLD